MDITALELFPILVALTVWGQALANKKIEFWCDNQAVVCILNTSTSKSERVMCLVRNLTMQCLKLNILLRAKHLPEIDNRACDALSRFQMAKFGNLVPDADWEPESTPECLWSVFSP